MSPTNLRMDSQRWLLLGLTSLFLTLGAPNVAAAGSPPKGKELAGEINLNTATLEQLRMLPGIGPAKAERIVEHRQKKPFRASWEITKVKGIGKAFFQKQRERLKVDGPTTLGYVDAGGGAMAAARPAEGGGEP